MEPDKKNSILGEIHSQIISWTENCDSKASIVMALEVVLSTVLFTSDYLMNTLETIAMNFIHYCKDGDGTFSFLALITILSFIAFSVMIGFSLFYLYNTLRARISSSTSSIIYWGKIAGLKREDFQHKIRKISDDDLQQDRTDQIYNCSQICNKKFAYYNKALFCVFWSFVPLILFILSSIIHNSVL